MDVQPTNGRRVSGPAEAMQRETIEALWSRLDHYHRAQATDAIASPDELGQLLAEVERLKVELQAERALYRSDDDHAVRVPVPLLAALELVARDVPAWRHAQNEWLARRAPHVDSVEAYVRLFEDLEILGQVESACFAGPRLDEILHSLTLDQLRALAWRDVQWVPAAVVSVVSVRAALATVREAAVTGRG